MPWTEPIYKGLDLEKWINYGGTSFISITLTASFTKSGNLLACVSYMCYLMGNIIMTESIGVFL